jgi:uncharacterized delta-60 repeat protein
MNRFGLIRLPRGRRPAALAALSILALVVAVSARGATLVSETTWGGAASEVTSGVAVANDGASYVTGFTTSFDQFGEEELFLAKHAADGTIAWQRTWEGPQQFANDRGTDVSVASDGSVYVTGSTLGVQGDVLLLKFSSDGSLLWQRRWDGGASERGEAVALALDGSVYVVGGTTLGEGHLVLLRFASDGALISQRIFGPARGDGIAVGADGSVYLAGGAARPGGGTDVVLAKLDPTGALVWQRAYSGSEIADARGGVDVGADGSAYVAGAIHETTGKVVVDALIVKFDAAGNLLWDRGWGGRSGDVGGGVAALADGTAVLVGDSNSFGAGSDDAFVLRLSAEGRGIDANTWGGLGIDHADDAVVAPDGTLVVGGTTENPAPYAFEPASSRAYRVRGSAAPSAFTLADVAGTVADPGGTAAVATGTTPGAGEFDAAILRIVP